MPNFQPPDSVLLVRPRRRRDLNAKNADNERPPPASLVKLMTLYLACEDLDAGRADVEEIVNRGVAHARHRRGNTAWGLRHGRGGAAARACSRRGPSPPRTTRPARSAERLAGDEPAFVARMNDRRAELGLNRHALHQPHGPARSDPGGSQRRRDPGHPHPAADPRLSESRPLLGGQTFVYRGRVYARHIPLFSDPGGVQALKTGFTQEAGYNLAVSAWRGGQQFLMIRARRAQRARSPFLDAKKLLQLRLRRDRTRAGGREAGAQSQSPSARGRATATRP